MGTFDFEALRPNRKDCPSGLTLERLHAGELEPPARELLAGHIGGCTACHRQMDELRAGFDAFEDVDPRRMLARIRTETDRRQQSSLGYRLRAVLASLATVAAVGAVMIARSSPDHDALGGRDTVALKGWGLYVYRLAGDRVERVLSGERFAPGDRIRFAVDVPGDGQVSIIGVEASGSLYTAWPLDGSTSSFLKQGQHMELPGAVTLDESKGKEVLYLAYCPASGPTPACTSGGPGKAPQCPSSCQLSPFVLVKA